MSLLRIKEPTADQCVAKASVDIGTGEQAFATWYPQMGGYGGKCVVVNCDNDDETPCFNVYVWHDGDFPFRSEDAEYGAQEPVRLHHCSAVQFLQFGEAVLEKFGGKA